MAHPQIAIFARLAKEGDAPQRVIFGQATRLNRNMHAVRYGRKRDEIHVTNQFAQAVLTFRGGASGQEPPIRIIQGPKTLLENPGTLEIDEVNNEIFVPQPGSENVLVFPLTANGDVAPLRILRSGRQNGWTPARPGGGIAVEPEDPEALARAIEALADDRERCRELGLAGARYVREHCTRTALAHGMMEALERHVPAAVPPAGLRSGVHPLDEEAR